MQPGLKHECKEGYAIEFSDTKEYPVLKIGVIPQITIKEAGDKLDKQAILHISTEELVGCWQIEVEDRN